jgi:hypothetical protein
VRLDPPEAEVDEDRVPRIALPTAAPRGGDPATIGSEPGSEPDQMPAAWHVERGTLTGMTLAPTPWGIVPVSTTAPVSWPDGPVRRGGDPAVDEALARGEEDLRRRGEHEAQKLAAESLVTRARCGDQNAMAILKLVGENAQKQGPQGDRARAAFAMVERYIAEHPVSESVLSGDGEPAGERASHPTPERTVARAAVILANGPELTTELVREMVSAFGGRRNRQQRALAQGIRGHVHDDDRSTEGIEDSELLLHDYGRAIGFARAVQIVRAGGSPAALSPEVGWELGVGLRRQLDAPRARGLLGSGR